MTIETIKPDQRWLNWNLVKGRKLPVYAGGTKRTKDNYDTEFTTDSLLVDFDTAHSTGAKLGFVTGQGVICIDIDNAITDGLIHPVAQEVIDTCNSYTEYSPSGNGFHIICKGKLPVVGQKLIYDNKDTGELSFDLFDGGQYVTYTGKHLKGTPKEINYVQNKTVQKFQSRTKSEEPENERSRTEKISEQAVSSAEWRVYQRRAKAQLEQSCEHIEFQPAAQGKGRKTAIWTHSGIVAEWVKAGLLNQKEAVQALTEAAQGQGEPLPIAEIERNIKSGFDIGCIKQPVTIEFLKRTDTTSKGGEAMSAKGNKQQIEFVSLGKPHQEVNLNVNWLIKGFLPRTGICGLYGDSFTGKSFIALDIAFAVATGADYSGHLVKAQGDVVYIAGEDAGGIEMRSHAYHQYHQLNKESPLYMLPSPQNMSNENSVETLSAAIEDRELSPRLIVVDTLATCFGGGDENSGQDMNKFMDGLRTLKERFDCCVLFVHHTGHKDKSRARGSSVLYAALDAEYIVKRQLKSEFINVECTKLKNNVTGKLFNENFRIDNVDLGVDQDGDQVFYGVAVNEGECEMSDFKDHADQIKITGRNQKLALAIVDEELGVTREELRGMLRAEGLSQQGAYDVVDKLIAKGALIQDGEMLYTSDGVTQALHNAG